ncbi:MAG: hypothetical protein LBG73_00125 [Spirochaetaceae bacterium]|jgi:clan AA aspartic protease|nr:hypothetical protein [Spirochaetaceae bacterium]
MGITREEITLTNEGDLAAAARGYITKKEARSVTVTAIADTGALRLVMPESLRKKLGLEILKTAPAALADGEKLEIGLTEGVEVRWKDRIITCDAWIVPNDCSVLLGAIPMEGLDVMGDPVNQRLVGVHGEKPLGILC